MKLLVLAAVAAAAFAPSAMSATYVIDFDALSERAAEVVLSFKPNPDPAIPPGVVGPGVVYTHHDPYFDPLSGVVQAYLDGVWTATTEVVAFGGARFDALEIDVLQAYSAVFLKGAPGEPATENLPLPPGVIFTGTRADGSVATVSMPVPYAPGVFPIGLTDLVSLTFEADRDALAALLRESCGAWVSANNSYENCIVGPPGYEMVATFDNLSLDIRGFVAPVPAPPAIFLYGALGAVYGAVGMLRRRHRGVAPRPAA